MNKLKHDIWKKKRKKYVRVLLKNSYETKLAEEKIGGKNKIVE